MHLWRSMKKRAMEQRSQRFMMALQGSYGPTHWVEMTPKRTIARLSTGEEVEYDIATDELKHGSGWDDVEYLGEGEYVRSISVK